MTGRRGRTRWPGLAAVATLVVAVMVAGCSFGDSGPGEEEMLPAKDLVYPGSVEVRRAFTEADKGRLVDGGTFDDPATLRVYYQVDGTLNIRPIVEWYQDKLAADGWELGELGEQERSLDVEITRNGFEHSLSIDGYQAGDQYELTYTIRPVE